jgi:asparagine synthase (glutamine-hydrolysing)
MRRSLVGIVPDELLNRKRKAFVVRGPIVRIGAQWTDLVELTQHMLASGLGIVDSQHFVSALTKARERQKVALVRILRTLIVESWMRNLQAWIVLPDTKSGASLAFQLRAQGLRQESLTLSDGG